MIKKVLVVGGAGYIGSAVVEALTRQGVNATVYDNLLYETHFLKPVPFISGDVRDSTKLSRLLRDYSHVVWLAAIVGDAACQIRPDLTVAINEEPLEWLARNYDGRIIFTSTCSIYGQNDEEVTEEATANPLSLYALTKLRAEKFLRQSNALILRLGTAYGISDYSSRLRMDLVVNYMTANAISKGKLKIYGGDQWRPFVHVKDIANVIINNLDKATTGPYNIATSNMQIKDLAKKVSSVTQCEVEYETQKFPDQRNYRVNINKALTDKVISTDDIHTVEYGINEIAETISSGRVKYAENDIYFNERHIANLLKNGQLN